MHIKDYFITKNSFVVEVTFKCPFFHHVETSQLICSDIQVTCFFMKEDRFMFEGKWALNRLTCIKSLTLSNYVRLLSLFLSCRNPLKACLPLSKLRSKSTDWFLYDRKIGFQWFIFFQFNYSIFVCLLEMVIFCSFISYRRTEF